MLEKISLIRTSGELPQNRGLVPSVDALEQPTNEWLEERLERTWLSLQCLIHQPEACLPADRLEITPEGIEVFTRTKPTNIGLGMLCQVVAERLGLQTESNSSDSLGKMIDSLGKLQRFQGFYYDWYCSKTGEVLTQWPDSGHNLDLFLSSVDNAWLALSLLIAQQAKPEFDSRIQAFLNEMDFEFFFDPKVQELWGGYSVSGQAYSQHHYSRDLLSEPRIIHWVQAALTSDMQTREQVLWRLLDSKGQVPQQLAGGAMFELLMPRLFIREQYLDSVVKRIFAQHEEYGKQHLGGLVGVSVADDPSHGNCYREMGVGGTYPSSTVVTAHGLALALLEKPELALRGLAQMEQIPGFFNELGYTAAADVVFSKPTNTQLLIDQAMVFFSLAYHISGPFLQDLFEKCFRQEATYVS